ncbi:hypothetical protein B0A49_08591, partial [Cryomyces minteri]
LGADPDATLPEAAGIEPLVETVGRTITSGTPPLDPALTNDLAAVEKLTVGRTTVGGKPPLDPGTSLDEDSTAEVGASSDEGAAAPANELDVVALELDVDVVGWTILEGAPALEPSLGLDSELDVELDTAAGEASELVEDVVWVDVVVTEGRAPLLVGEVTEVALKLSVVEFAGAVDSVTVTTTTLVERALGEVGDSVVVTNVLVSVDATEAAADVWYVGGSSPALCRLASIDAYVGGVEVGVLDELEISEVDELDDSVALLLVKA